MKNTHQLTHGVLHKCTTGVSLILEVIDSGGYICHHKVMIAHRYLATRFLVIFFICFGGAFDPVRAEKLSTDTSPAPAAADASPDETAFYSDRFIFRSKSVDDLVIVVFSFERGKQAEGYYGEFFGAVFERNHWAFLEGNDKYAYASTDLKTIFPSYYAKIVGTDLSGFVASYDGGDYTLKLSSGPIAAAYPFHDSETLKKNLGITEAVVTVNGKEHWGDLVHESLFWKGFEGLKRYKGLYKNYQAFFLKTEEGRQIYFYKNQANRKAFLKKHHLAETLQSEGGVVLVGGKTTEIFQPPILLSPINKTSLPFAFYKVPERWDIDLSPGIGSLQLWTRARHSINWIFGGYVIMAIEGVVKKGDGEERVWGFAEFFP